MSQQTSNVNRSGFSLLELLVVIGIIGVLSGVMLQTFGGASESAQSAKCMANLRNLASAVYTAAAAHSEGAMPAAGSFEYFSMKYIHERKGWISWLNDTRPNVYGGKNTKSRVQSSWTPYATYRQGSRSDVDKSRFALTNGVLWQYAGRTAETYVCPVHSKLCRKKKLVPSWSYVMNSYFGYDYKKGGTVEHQHRKISKMTSLINGIPLGGDKVLLFAELPFLELKEIGQSGDLEGSSSKFDCTLQYDAKKWSGGAESIGFNHKSGKNYVAHVAYADGHVAKLMLPKNANAGMVKDLTTWLCQGDDVSFDGRTYTRVQIDSGTK